jgi:hypothetical protein
MDRAGFIYIITKTTCVAAFGSFFCRCVEIMSSRKKRNATARMPPSALTQPLFISCLSENCFCISLSLSLPASFSLSLSDCVLVSESRSHYQPSHTLPGTVRHYIFYEHKELTKCLLREKSIYVVRCSSERKRERERGQQTIHTALITQPSLSLALLAPAGWQRATLTLYIHTYLVCQTKP